MCMNEEQGGNGWMLAVPRRWEILDIRVKKLMHVCVCGFRPGEWYVIIFFYMSLCVLHVHVHTEVSNNTFDNRKCRTLFPFLVSFLFLTSVMASRTSGAKTKFQSTICPFSLCAESASE